MGTPQKPWENLRNSIHANVNSGVMGRNALHSHAPQSGGYIPTVTGPVPVSQRASTLPPLPQRPQQLYNRPSLGMGAPAVGGYPGYGTYGGYGASSYGGYGASSYGGYGASSYGGYGSMYGMGGYGYGSYPVGAGFENRFLQVAEENSRDAFQSIESIVRAFTSVSMMLESTYYAMYSSFRAILGVVDNFSRLRQMFVQFLSTVTILRIIRNFYRRLLYWLGALDQNPQVHQVWESVNGQAGGEQMQQVANSPKWPLITFIAFLFGGPYLISKFFKSGNSSVNQWDVSKGRYVRTAYPHQAGTQAELSFQANELLNLAPKELQTQEALSGWFLASNQRGQVGYVPITRVTKSSSPTNTFVKPSTTTPPTPSAPSEECSVSQPPTSNEAPKTESQ